MRVLETPAACKFCKNVTEKDIVLERNGTTICYKCIYRANKVQKTFPDQAIYCFKCKEHRIAFRVIYGATVLAAKTVVTFAFLELDCKGKPMYAPTRVTAPWEADAAVPVECTCVGCNNRLPLWMLRQNSYMQAYNRDPNDKAS